jgi:hypothetical protein
VFTEKTNLNAIRLPSVAVSKRRQTKQYSFWLSEIVNRAIDEAARRSDCTRSDVLEYVFCSDLVDLIPRFEAGETFSQVVLATKLPADRIREAYAQWKQGYDSRLVENPAVVKMKTDVQKLRLEVKKEVAESQERTTMAKLETRKDITKARVVIAEIQAGSKAREIRMQALTKPSRFAK